MDGKLAILTDADVARMFPGAEVKGFTSQQMRAVLLVVDAYAKAIHDVGPRGIPSGVLYANLAHMVNLETHLGIIALLKRAGLITERGHLLTWLVQAGVDHG